MKIHSIIEFYSCLTPQEHVIVDVLRQLISSELPSYCKEKISYNVPYFYGHRGICLIWPASIPRGGIKQGVLLGFWNGFRLKDEDRYLVKGSNKKIYYKIFQKPEDIDLKVIQKLLHEAIELDLSFKTN